MKPEEQSELIIWDWLKTKGEYIKEVYFNRKNELGWKTFTTSGVNKKPDFIVAIDRGYGIEYIAIEIKNSKKSKDVYDACKILDYYENYFLKKTKYFIEKEEIIISHFAIATDKSIEGHLLRKERDFFDNLNDAEEDDDNAKYKRFMVEQGYFPRYEYYTTGVYLRLLWANWRRLKKELSFEKAPSVGIIISEPKQKDNPYFFTMVYCDWFKEKKGHWGQRFWRL